MKLSKLTRKTDKEKLCFGSIKTHEIRGHPVMYRNYSSPKVTNVTRKISGRKRQVKLGIISIKAMTSVRNKNETTQRSTVQDK